MAPSVRGAGGGGAAMSPGRVVLLLSLLFGLQPITTDLYLPALPAITRAFGAQPSQAQLSLFALLLAFGITQLIWGPLSDCVGRRKVLLWGLAGYTAAAVGCASANSMEALVGWRIVQGACMGAATVCARAILRDLYSPAMAAQMMSRAMSGLGVAAALAPLLGGTISDLLGWRTAMSALLVVGVVVFFLVWRYFRETLPEPEAGSGRLSSLARRSGEIGRSPDFWAFGLLCTFSFAGLVSFLTTSSFVLIEQHGMGTTTFGFALLSLSAFYIAGTMLCRRALAAWGLPGALLLGGGFSLAGGGALVGLAAAGVGGIWSLIVPAWIYMLGHGFHQPCGQSGAVAPFPAAAGTASALTGLVMMAVAFGSGRWIGANMDGSAAPLVCAMATWSVATAGMALYCARRARQAAAGDAVVDMPKPAEL